MMLQSKLPDEQQKSDLEIAGQPIQPLLSELPRQFLQEKEEVERYLSKLKSGKNEEYFFRTEESDRLLVCFMQCLHQIDPGFAWFNRKTSNAKFPGTLEFTLVTTGNGNGEEVVVSISGHLSFKKYPSFNFVSEVVNKGCLKEHPALGANERKALVYKYQPGDDGQGGEDLFYVAYYCNQNHKTIYKPITRTQIEKIDNKVKSGSQMSGDFILRRLVQFLGQNKDTVKKLNLDFLCLHKEDFKKACLAVKWMHLKKASRLFKEKTGIALTLLNGSSHTVTQIVSEQLREHGKETDIAEKPCAETRSMAWLLKSLSSRSERDEIPRINSTVIEMSSNTDRGAFANAKVGDKNQYTGILEIPIDGKSPLYIGVIPACDTCQKKKSIYFGDILEPVLLRGSNSSEQLAAAPNTPKKEMVGRLRGSPLNSMSQTPPCRFFSHVVEGSPSSYPLVEGSPSSYPLLSLPPSEMEAPKI
ncbi:MAG: hypothetical protein A3F10_03960 [Coxiella sp. RIFCSPHIGHO2_12_FULL_42_15]|nr:MAG: hypothetical protein A3F10_03960 [Coxiella sp. RIFCSPHIGHO2_12_FULL_42_15]